MLQQIKTKAILVLAFLLGVISVDMLAQQSVSEKKIGLPPNTVEGVLPNGLHYLILPNGTPAHTTEFRLVMRLGSAQETDNQKGAAHFLEHMSFAGSKHFPGRGMVDYLESLGMKFGRDINAVTGYDRTIFMLTVPMDKTDSAVSDKVLLILKDWLDGQGYHSTIAFNADKAMYRVIVNSFADKTAAAEARDAFKAKYPSRTDFQGAWLLYRVY